MLVDNDDIFPANIKLFYSPGLYDMAVLFDEEIFEAWERMTYGGVVVINERDTAGENQCPAYLPPYPCGVWHHASGRL